MKGVKTTAENLQEAVTGEEFEFKNMYPGFIEDALADDNKAALNSFQNAMAVEQVHYSLYISALDKLKEGSDLEEAKIYVCSVCGNTVLDEAPEKCPVCGVGPDKFSEIK